MNRRNFIKKSILGSLALGIPTALYSWKIEPIWVEYSKLKMNLMYLPSELNGKMLVQISDLHIGNRFDYRYMIDVFKKVNELKPEFVVYTGDFVHYQTPQQLEQLEEFCPFLAKGNLKTLGVLGNHDYGKNWGQTGVADKISEILNRAEITILRNEQIEVAGLNFIGIDDYWSPNFNGEKAMKNYDTKKASLVLCHNPDVCDLDIWSDFHGWVLSGHTHGGQCKLPFFRPPILPVKNKRYSAGKIELDKRRTLYINRAIGHSFPIRLGVRPEITLFELIQTTNETDDYFFTI